jgi:hypothetical protein
VEGHAVRLNVLAVGRKLSIGVAVMDAEGAGRTHEVHRVRN